MGELKRKGAWVLDNLIYLCYKISIMYKYKAKRDHARDYASQKAEKYPYREFIKEYGDDTEILNMLWVRQYGKGTIECPKCKKYARYYHKRKTTQYECSRCGHLITPLKNTIFYRSHVSLSMWFYAIYLFTINKNGLSAKELERALGVQYKTAYNMLHKIRDLVAGENYNTYFHGGTTEIDDSYFGGKLINKHAKEIQAIKAQRGGKGITGRSNINKTLAIGAVNREEGKVHVETLDTDAPTLSDTDNFIVDTLDKQRSRVITDDWTSYMKLHRRGVHHSVVEHGKGEYGRGDVHTNGIENLWSNIKRGLDGTYRGVSRKHLQKYLHEFVFRYNHRGERVFDAFLALLPYRPEIRRVNRIS